VKQPKLSTTLFDRNTQTPSPEGVTNRPRDARLLASGGTVRRVRLEPRLPLFAFGVLAGILLCLVVSLVREAERAAEARPVRLEVGR